MPVKKVSFLVMNWKLEISTYPNWTNAINLTEAEEGKLTLTATAYIAGIKLAEDEAVLKNYAENNGIFEALVESGVIKPAGRYAGSPLRPIGRISQ